MQPSVEFLAFQPAVSSDRPTNLQLLIRLRAPEPTRGTRPRLNLGLCIDRSGSMVGPPMDRALEASAHVIDRLESTDYVSVVAFDSVNEVPVPARQVNDASTILPRLKDIFARGGTALYHGWLEAVRQTETSSSHGRLSRVLVLSDGQANEGLTDPTRIAAQVAHWKDRGISTSTVGLGNHYNEDLLSSMAAAGNGSFYHVQTPADIATSFQLELQGMCSTFAQGITLGLRTGGDVELLQVVNPVERDADGHLMLADLVTGCPIDVVVDFLVPPQSQEQALCRFTLSWFDVGTGERGQSLHELRLPVVPHGQLAEFPQNLEVRQKRALQMSARLLVQAIEKLDAGDKAGAKMILTRGLDGLNEVEPSSQLSAAAERFRKMLGQLEAGAAATVRKEARYQSSSTGYGSLSLSGVTAPWLALPEAERTAEKLKELMDQAQRRRYGAS